MNEPRGPLPKEVLSFLRERKCPVCKYGIESTDNDLIMFNLMGVYNTWADCKQNKYHYQLDIHWHDPKNIIIHSEEIEFENEEEYYEVKINRGDLNKRFINDIKWYRADEDLPIELTIEGDLFNLKRFSAKSFAQKIKMLLTFG